MDKQLQRKSILELRNRISPQEIVSRSVQVFSHIPDDLLQSSQSFHSFIGVIQKHEINTLTLLVRLFREQKHIAIPYITAQKTMVSCVLNNLEQLVEGPFGLLQPIELTEPANSMYDVIFVPGLAFDRNGNRLGYGKGYYDQFLENQQKSLKIGLCFNFQVLDHVIVDKHDIKMDWIVSETELIKVNG